MNDTIKSSIDDLNKQFDELAKAKENLTRAQEDIRQIISVLIAIKEGAVNND